MSLEAALTLARRWLDEVSGVHAVGEATGDDGEPCILVLAADVDEVVHQLPRRLLDVAVVVEQAERPSPEGEAEG